MNEVIKQKYKELKRLNKWILDAKENRDELRADLKSLESKAQSYKKLLLEVKSLLDTKSELSMRIKTLSQAKNTILSNLDKEKLKKNKELSQIKKEIIKEKEFLKKIKRSKQTTFKDFSYYPELDIKL